MGKKLISELYSYGEIEAGMSRVGLFVEKASERQELTIKIRHPNHINGLLNIDLDKDNLVKLIDSLNRVLSDMKESE